MQGTTRGILLTGSTRRKLRAAIRVWRGNVLDAEIVVDDARRAVDGAGDALRAAVRERDRAARQLAHLVALHDELTALSEPVRCAITARAAARVTESGAFSE